MTIQDKIDEFFSSPAFAVAGASNNRSKFGNKVLRCYLQHGKAVTPVHPAASEIEGIKTVPSIKALPPEVRSVSIITSPEVTLKLVQEAIACGICNIWMQPGAEHPDAIKLCHENKINLIADGTCILVVLGYHDH